MGGICQVFLYTAFNNSWFTFKAFDAVLQYSQTTFIK